MTACDSDNAAIYRPNTYITMPNEKKERYKKKIYINTDTT